MLRLTSRCFTWSQTLSRSHPEFHLHSSLYHHSRLKTPLLHIKSRDSHKACVLLYKTTPENDKGTAHCLERMVLCGSQRFPVRDPFACMVSRSLNTYANAWTGADFTAYPFSTVNQQDFQNLLRVYLDATLVPLLRDIDFRQEAIRLDITEKGLAFDGNVYREMKQLLSESDAYISHQLSKNLFPDTAYEFNSGGDPEALLTLTNSELKDYHRRYYHPSNAVLLMYGDMDIERTLHILESEYFHQFEYLDVKSEVKNVKRLEVPKTVKLACPVNPGLEPSLQSTFAVSYLCNSLSEDPYIGFCMNILSMCLFDSPQSPLYKSLIESGLGLVYAPGTGYDNTTKEASFTIGVSGCTETNFPVIEKTILKTLSELMEKGINSDLIESAIHKTELKYKEKTENFGLLLLSSMLPYTIHGSNPLTPLYLNDYTNKLRTEIAENKPLFQHLIRTYLWDNSHKIIFHITSDSEFLSRKTEFEKRQLQRIAEEMDPKTQSLIVQEAQEMREKQDSLQNIDVLPTLLLTDLPQKIDKIEYNKSILVDKIPVKFIELPTNGINYLRIKSNISDLPIELRELLPLYTQIFNEMGTKSHSVPEFTHLKEKFTISGFPCSYFVSSLKNSIESHKEILTFSVGFLERNSTKIFDLLTEILTQIDFSNHSQLSAQIQSQIKLRNDQFLRNPVDFAVSLSCSSLTSAANSYENLSCVSLI